MSKKASILEQIKRKKDGILDCHTHVGIGFPNYLRNEYPYCMSFEEAVIRMKYLGINWSVMMPFATSCYFSLNPSDPSKVETTEEFSSFPYEIENRNLFKEVNEVFPEYSEMALPFAIFDPSRKTQEQADLLGELNESYPLFGLKTVTTYIQSFVTDLETKGKPILEFMQKHDLPVIFHSSWDKNDPWANVFDILEFAKRHPEIRICIAHSARFTKAVLDQAETLDNCFVDLSAFDIHCQLATQNHRALPTGADRVDLNYSNPCDAMAKLVATYPNTIIWGTDMPYNYFIQKFYDGSGKLVDVELKSSFDKEMKILNSLDEITKKRIAHDLTLKFILGSSEVV